MQLPDASWTAPPIISQYVGEAVWIALQYWEKIHWWMPIISKTTFYDQAMNPLVPRSIDVLLLLATMKLVMWHPREESRPDREYAAIRHAIHEAEGAGVMTVRLLQAKLLLTFYEFGHGMYPAAYFSVASCARFGTALGINQCLQTTDLSVSSDAALELEEKKRAWWAILMLDRLVMDSFSWAKSLSLLVSCNWGILRRCSVQRNRHHLATYL